LSFRGVFGARGVREKRFAKAVHPPAKRRRTPPVNVPYFVPT